MLIAIAQTAATSDTLDLHISVFVTCICDPEAIPPIPNSVVTIRRPSVTHLLRDLVTPPSETLQKEKQTEQVIEAEIEEIPRESSSEQEQDLEEEVNGLRWIPLGGGIGVCAAGPETLTRETQNAVARLGMLRGVELGGIGLHTELYRI